MYSEFPSAYPTMCDLMEEVATAEVGVDLDNAKERADDHRQKIQQAWERHYMVPTFRCPGIHAQPPAGAIGRQTINGLLNRTAAGVTTQVRH